MRDSAIINIRKLYSALLYGTNVAGHIVYAYTEKQIYDMYQHIYMYTHNTQNACCGCCLHSLPAFPNSQFSDSIIWQLAVLDNAITSHHSEIFIIALCKLYRSDCSWLSNPHRVTAVSSYKIQWVPFFLFRSSIPVT